MRNYIGISQQEQNKNIYRIFKVERLIELFEEKNNALVKPELWDDPFENFILNITVKSKTGRISKSILRNRGYGQCWTLTIESDAMWRIYSPDKNGVKIQTSIRKLFQSLYSTQTSYGTLSCFIGKVKYYSKKKIDDIVKDRLAGVKQFSGSLGQARSLLFKRYAFKHENEVRLIYLEPHNQIGSSVYPYPCDPLILVDRVTFDPRMSPKLFKIYKDHLRAIGYKGTVIQSGLYRPPAYG